MAVYQQSILTAFLFFPFVSFLLTLPYMLYSYRRYGAVSWLRSLILFSFLLYLLCAYFLVILPLPSRASVAAREGPFFQLVPFHFVQDFLRNTVFRPDDPSTFFPALRQRIFLEPVFNVLLTMPFGAYVYYYFGKSKKTTILLTFCLSLFFELTQLSGLYFIYSKPYRLFDVDDLMTNTLGGALGIAVGALFRKGLPSKREIDESSVRKSYRVGYIRRLFAVCLDLFCLFALQALLDHFLESNVPPLSLLYLCYFVILPSLTRGRTPGKWFVRIRTAPSDSGTLPFPLRLLIKYGAVYITFLYFILTLPLLKTASLSLALTLIASYGLLMLLFFIDWLFGFRYQRRLWYERLSQTQNASLQSQPTTPQ